MKKLLAYVEGNMNPAGLYKPVGWLVMPISDGCVNVEGLTCEGAGMSMTTWRQVYSAISKELVKTPWQPVYKNPFTIDGFDEIRMFNFDMCIQGAFHVTDFMVMDEREYYLLCDKHEGEQYEQNM